MNKYIGVYRVFQNLDFVTKKASLNNDDTYLKGRYKSEVYRWDKKNLCVYFPSGKSTTNVVLPQLDDLNVKYELHLESEYEHVYLVKESDIDKIHSVLKFSIKGKNVQAKSVKTARKLAKQQEKLEKQKNTNKIKK